MDLRDYYTHGRWRGRGQRDLTPVSIHILGINTRNKNYMHVAPHNPPLATVIWDYCEITGCFRLLGDDGRITEHIQRDYLYQLRIDHILDYREYKMELLGIMD